MLIHTADSPASRVRVYRRIDAIELPHLLAKAGESRLPQTGEGAGGQDFL
jgi:hypothetical protein